nr:hypothetical protein [Klebsiella pneumoniae subsp. pneumoniae]
MDANKARTLSQKLKLFSRLRPRDLLPVPRRWLNIQPDCGWAIPPSRWRKAGGSREQQDAWRIVRTSWQRKPGRG